MTEPQLTQDDLAHMTPDEIVKARTAGRLSTLLTGEAVEEAPARRFQGNAEGGHRSEGPYGGYTASQLESMSPEQIVELHHRGHLDNLLNRPTERN